MEIENIVKIIPATEEQKKQYAIYKKNEKEITNNFINSIDSDGSFDAIFDNYEKNFPEFSKEQLEAFPDFINDYELTDSEKILVLLDQFEEIKLYEKGITFFVDENNFLKQLSIHNDENKNDLIRFISEDQIRFKNEEVLTPILNIQIMKNQDPNELEVVGVTRPLKVNDPVAFIIEGKHLQGKIESFGKEGEMNVKVYNSKEIKNLTLPSTVKVDPLFILDKTEKMVYLKFTYEEAVAALKNKNDINTNFKKGENPIFSLMLGNKTDVIAFEKKIEDKMAPVEGRLELKRMPNSGIAYLDSNVKFKELDLDRPIYGLKLNEEQKSQLKKTGELGLVSGFKTKEGKDFNLWVSLDSKLNKVVTARENDIYIDKIFGVVPTDEQKNKIKSGEGALLEIKDKKYFIQASAATTKADGIKSFTEEKAKEFKLIPEDKKEEKKNSKAKGMKV